MNPHRRTRWPSITRIRRSRETRYSDDFFLQLGRFDERGTEKLENHCGDRSYGRFLRKGHPASSGHRSWKVAELLGSSVTFRIQIRRFVCCHDLVGEIVE